MILLALALAQADAPPPPTEDVVVIGERLKRWRGRIVTTPLGTSCRTVKSTGDREIDAIGCTAMERCWPETLPRLKAAHAKGVAPADRKRLEAEAAQAFAACGKPQRDALVDALRARRAVARAGA